MSPKAADPKVRTALIEAAARILADEGPTALSARRLAREVGASTTALYTHFGSMNELRRAVRREGFARFATHIDRVGRDDDPVVELAALCPAYVDNAFENPDLYRVMFMEVPLDDEDWATGWDTFERLVATVQRCLDAGRIPGCPDARQGATEIWALTHGAVSLALAGLVPKDDAFQLVGQTAAGLLMGWGLRS